MGNQRLRVTNQCPFSHDVMRSILVDHNKKDRLWATNAMITASSMKASLAKQIFVSLCLRLSHLVQIIQCWRNTLHRKWTARTAVEVNTRDERFTALCSSCRQKDSKGGNFTFLFCRGQHGILLEFLLLVPHA